MEKVTAKFFCEQVVTNDHGTEVHMRPDFPKSDNPGHPNRKFWEATPSGNLQMVITNKSAAEYFKRGSVYTLEFTEDPAEGAEQTTGDEPVDAEE